MAPAQSHKRRFLGLSKVQAIILAGMAWLVVAILIAGFALILHQQTITPTPGSNTVAGVAPTYPPTWTPTPPPLPTATKTPQPTPAPLEITPTSTPLGLPEPPLPTFGAPTATPPGEDITDPNYLAGKRAYKARDYPEVLRRMDLVVKANPKLAPAYWYRGMAHYYLKDYQAGLREMEQALALDPNYALGYADRGLMYRMLGETDKAKTDWRRALWLDPTLAKVHHNIGALYRYYGDRQHAIQEYEIAVAIDPLRSITWTSLARTYLDLNDNDQCIKNATRAIELPTVEWYAYYVRGICYEYMGDHKQAIADFDRYLSQMGNAAVFYEIEPHEADALNNRGYAHYRLGNYQQALHDYNRAIELNPRITPSYIFRGEIYAHEKQYEAAIADFTTSLGLEVYSIAYHDRAEAYRALRRYAEAEADYKHLLSESPGNLGLYHELIDLYLEWQKYQTAIDTATDAFARYCAQGSWCVDLLRLRGQAYLALKDYAHAIDDLKAASLSQTDPEDDYYLGLAYEANGQVEAAIQSLSQFVDNPAAKDSTHLGDARSRLARLRKQ